MTYLISVFSVYTKLETLSKNLIYRLFLTVSPSIFLSFATSNPFSFFTISLYYFAYYTKESIKLQPHIITKRAGHRLPCSSYAPYLCSFSSCSYNCHSSKSDCCKHCNHHHGIAFTCFRRNSGCVASGSCSCICFVDCCCCLIINNKSNW